MASRIHKQIFSYDNFSLSHKNWRASFSSNKNCHRKIARKFAGMDEASRTFKGLKQSGLFCCSTKYVLQLTFMLSSINPKSDVVVVVVVVFFFGLQRLFSIPTKNR